MSQLAFVFPGQGAQKVGMLAEAAAEFAEIQETFQQASDALGYDLWALAQNGPQEELNLTEVTQPLLLTSSIALWRVWTARGGSLPAYMAGHSLGEYSALVASDVVSFEDAVALVRNRGRYMQEAVPVGHGAMSAVIGLDDEAIVATCQELSTEGAVVEAVNFNTPGQVVIAGHEQAVQQAGDALKSSGAKRVMPLPVSAPFHTSLMQPAAEKLADDIAAIAFSAPRIPIVHNVCASPEQDPAKIKSLMIDQTASPVLWTGCVGYILAQGVADFVECGPGKALTGMVKKIDRDAAASGIEAPSSLLAKLES